MKRLNYGQLPNKADFLAAFEQLCPDGYYEIRNCRELDAVYSGGNVDFTADELWQFLNECIDCMYDNHEGEYLASCVLSTLGWEWV